MVLGAAAIAAGGGQAGMGIMAAGQQAAISKYLAFSRVQESSADAAATRYMHSAQISCGAFSTSSRSSRTWSTGSISTPTGLWPDAPGERRRISTLQQTCEQDAAWNAKVDPALEIRFERVKAKLVGFVSEPKRTLQLYPLSDQSIPAHYARLMPITRAPIPSRRWPK